MNLGIKVKTKISVYISDKKFETSNIFLASGIDWWCQMLASNSSSGHSAPDAIYVSENNSVNRTEDSSLSAELTAYNGETQDALSRWWEKKNVGGQNRLYVHYGGYFSHDTVSNFTKVGLANSGLDLKYTGALVPSFSNNGSDIYIDYLVEIVFDFGYNYVQDSFITNLGNACIGNGNMNLNKMYYWEVESASWHTTGNIMERSYSQNYVERNDSYGYNTFFDDVSLTYTWRSFNKVEVRDNGNVLLSADVTASQANHKVEFVSIKTYFEE